MPVFATLALLIAFFISFVGVIAILAYNVVKGNRISKEAIRKYLIYFICIFGTGIVLTLIVACFL